MTTIASSRSYEHERKKGEWDASICPQFHVCDFYRTTRMHSADYEVSK